MKAKRKLFPRDPSGGPGSVETYTVIPTAPDTQLGTKGANFLVEPSSYGSSPDLTGPKPAWLHIFSHGFSNRFVGQNSHICSFFWNASTFFPDLETFFELHTSTAQLEPEHLARSFLLGPRCLSNSGTHQDGLGFLEDFSFGPFFPSTFPRRPFSFGYHVFETFNSRVHLHGSFPLFVLWGPSKTGWVGTKTGWVSFVFFFLGFPDGRICKLEAPGPPASPGIS